jgi:photosystem II stability/assembly factor-like uncharacterized protein
LTTVYALDTSPDIERDGICFAASESGLYRSDDGGVRWKYAFESLQLEASPVTPAVAVSPHFSKDNTVFAGVSGAVVRSIDGGYTWDVVVLPEPSPHVTILAVSPSFDADGVVLAATLEDGVFRSADRGRHWTGWNFGLLDLVTLTLALSPGFKTDETIFVGTETGVFRSTNGGRAWREVGFPTEHAPVLSLALSPNFTDDGILFAGTESHGLFYSDDGGGSWVRRDGKQITESVNAIILSPHYPDKPDVLAALSKQVLVSRDGGASWMDWHEKSDVGTIVSVAAPYGLDKDAHLLVGLLDSGVLKI